MAGEGALGGGQYDFGTPVQVGIGMGHARHFFAGIGVGGHKTGDLVAQRIARCLHDIAFGGADIHDQHLGRDQVLDGFECGFGSAHRARPAALSRRRQRQARPRAPPHQSPSDVQARAVVVGDLL